MRHGVCARMDMFLGGEFVLHFLKSYTVKCLGNEYSDSQGHSEYISIERMS